jgi:hypothetical protein
MTQAINDYTPTPPPLTSGKTAVALMETVEGLKQAVLPAESPDAELIALCAEHSRNIEAYNNNNPFEGEKAEAIQPDGSEHPAHCPAEDWAWDIVNDLLRTDAIPNPDAELIRLCTEIDRIEDQWLSTLPVGGDIPDTVAAGISAQQEPLIEQICDMTASTLDGMRARARTIVKWAPDLVSMPHDAADDMVAALLRDLIGEARV